MHRDECSGHVLWRCRTCYREEQNRLEAAGQTREGNCTTNVSEQSFLWSHSVPGGQPSRERLPPTSWAVVGLGVGMMALRCAVLCCAVLCGVCCCCSRCLCCVCSAVGICGGRSFFQLQVWALAEVRGTCAGGSKSRKLASNHGIRFRPPRANQAHGNPKQFFEISNIGIVRQI